MGLWWEASSKLIQSAHADATEARRLVKRLTRSRTKVEEIVSATVTRVAKAFRVAFRKASESRNEVQNLLSAVKIEITTTDKEIKNLERMVALQEAPLKQATLQLKV